jgi:hypothetical protein
LGKNFLFPGRALLGFLGFPAQCIVDVDSAVKDFERNKLWREISKEIVCHRPRTNDIHRPTLWFMHKWLGYSLFPRNNFCMVRNDELKLLYDLVKRKKVCPVKFMMTQWTKIPGLKGDVGCTSLVTHIAENLGLLENASVTYINTSYWIIDYGYFNHAHMLKKGKNGKIVMMYMTTRTSSYYQTATSVYMW